jgi:hypothetical protein
MFWSPVLTGINLPKIKAKTTKEKTTTNFLLGKYEKKSGFFTNYIVAVL